MERTSQPGGGGGTGQAVALATTPLALTLHLGFSGPAGPEDHYGTSRDSAAIARLGYMLSLPLKVVSPQLGGQSHLSDEENGFCWRVRVQHRLASMCTAQAGEYVHSGVEGFTLSNLLNRFGFCLMGIVNKHSYDQLSVSG